jgi:hypothetical protein
MWISNIYVLSVHPVPGGPLGNSTRYHVLAQVLFTFKVPSFK